MLYWHVKKVKKFRMNNSVGMAIIFYLILIYPVIGERVDAHFPLHGVVENAKAEFSIKGLMDGSYQNNMNSYLLGNMPGRNAFVKLNSQIEYSLFDVSSNANVVIGKNKQLFEEEYLDYSLNRYGQPSEEEVQILVDKLQVLQERLAAKDKQLYIFITPSKGRYYADSAPYYYKACAGDNSKLAYDTFISSVQNTDLNVYDSIAFIDQNKENFDFPLWYPTGIHWSRILGSTVAEDFNKYLSETSGYDLGQIKVSYEKSNEFQDPDADLYQTLNLFCKPSETYWNVSIEATEGTQKPNVFLRGGSFMGQSLSNLIGAKLFDQDIHFENNYYFTNNYSSSKNLSNFDAYGELDVNSYLNQSDILILEVNEEKIFTMSWGFIDYVLENYN